MKHIAACIVLLVSLCPPAAAGDTDESDFFSLERASLEESLNVKTSVATRSSVPLRETPGLVTVMTGEEIRASGARDLIDVLKLVPDFSFGVDVQGNLGLGVRGNWANEGKVLLIWDGQVYNEILYSTIQFDRFPVDQIETIEIIRGPGSVIYGGFAELAVINVKTRSPKNLNGSEAYAAYGHGEKVWSRYYGGYSFGKVLDGTEVSAKAFWGEAQRSSRRYTDFSGASYSMNGSSGLRPKSLALYAARRKTELRLIVDYFSLRDRDHFGEVIPGSSEVGFPTVFMGGKYSWELSDVLRLEPELNYTVGKPWLEKDRYFPYDKRTARFMASLRAFYLPGGASDFMFGGEYYNDLVKIDPFTGATSAAGSDERESYDNIAFFGQGNFDTPPAKLTAGARYDRNSRYGDSLVPRVAATRIVKRFNFKAIYSKAFRAPSIENIRLNGDIKPEKTSVTELEAGYILSDALYVYGNASETVIKRPIIFYLDDSANEHYANYSRTGTRGFGTGLKYKDGAVRFSADYYTYRARANRVDIYAVAGRGGSLLGFPRHKVTLSSSLPVDSGLSLNPSAIYLSRRYGYSGAGTLEVFKETVLAGVNFQLKDRPVKDLTLNIGVSDLFNSGYSYIQPYDGGHAPLPAPSREIFIKAAYEF